MSALAKLAATINAEHEQIWRSGRTALEHAVTCGTALLEAQRQVEHGGWLRWLSEYVTFHPTTAYKYMRLARFPERVLAPDVDGVEAGLRLLAAEPWHNRVRLDDDAKAEMVELAESQTLEEIAEAFGVARSTVWRWVSDKSPARMQRYAPVRSTEITDEMIERLGEWLCRRFKLGDLTDAVRNEACDALRIAIVGT